MQSFRLLKMEPRREIKLSHSNEYLCFETDDRSGGFLAYSRLSVSGDDQKSGRGANGTRGIW